MLYRVPAVMMVESPILVARSANRLMYLSPPRACGGLRACSSNTFPSPPSSMMYSIPKWACRDPTLSRNQLTAPGLVMFSFTQNFPCHWLITGTWGEINGACFTFSPSLQLKVKMLSQVTTFVVLQNNCCRHSPAVPGELRGGWASRPRCRPRGRCGTAWCPRPGKGIRWWKC